MSQSLYLIIRPDMNECVVAESSEQALEIYKREEPFRCVKISALGKPDSTLNADSPEYLECSDWSCSAPLHKEGSILENTKDKYDESLNIYSVLELLSLSSDIIDILNEVSDFPAIDEYDGMERCKYLGAVISLFKAPNSVDKNLRAYLLLRHPKLKNAIGEYWSNQATLESEKNERKEERKLSLIDKMDQETLQEHFGEGY